MHTAVLYSEDLTFLSGFWISGRTAQNGLMTSKNLTAKKKEEKEKRVTKRLAGFKTNKQKKHKISYSPHCSP